MSCSSLCDKVLGADVAGQQAHTFNNQAYVHIGGRKEKNGTIVRHFQGTIAGRERLGSKPVKHS